MAFSSADFLTSSIACGRLLFYSRPYTSSKLSSEIPTNCLLVSLAKGDILLKDAPCSNGLIYLASYK